MVTKSVLFIENTKGGEVAKKMRELMKRLDPKLGFMIKTVERSGTSLLKVPTWQPVEQSTMWPHRLYYLWPRSRAPP